MSSDSRNRTARLLNLNPGKRPASNQSSTVEAEMPSRSAISQARRSRSLTRFSSSHFDGSTHSAGRLTVWPHREGASRCAPAVVAFAFTRLGDALEADAVETFEHVTRLDDVERQ
jgi:hypothetical protein